MILRSILTLFGHLKLRKTGFVKNIIILDIIPANPKCYEEADPLSVTLRSSVRIRYGAMVWVSIMKVGVCGICLTWVEQLKYVRARISMVLP